MQTAYQCFSSGEYAGPMDIYDDILPNGATWIEPPAKKEGYIQVFKNGQWTQVEDHRKEEGYLNGVRAIINEIGPLPEGWSTEPPEPTEQEKQGQRREQIKAELSALDLQAVRPLRAIAAGTATDADHAKLAELEAQAEKLRAELSALEDK